MDPLHRIYQAAKRLDRHIVLPEGRDPRVAEAAARLAAEGLARITLMDGPDLPGVTALAPAEAPDLPQLAEKWHQIRAAKGMTAGRALEEMRDPIRQAAMRVRLGQADGTVGGAVATTADTVRAALQVIGKAPKAGIVSSFFLMLPGREDAPVRDGLIFSDCGLVIQPDAAELSAIALSAAESCRRILGEVPRVALLSFSTAGSADHPSLGRIREAVSLIRAAAPDLEVDGEMQFDAALDLEIRAKKAPASPLTGRANVYVFPDLAAGNIGYKIAQRLGGWKAIGPILQGLAKPANDLSRGCSVQDIVDAAAITAIQAKSEKM
ncbi:phosphate acetyltransferase [Paracoccus aminovorans]|uniref:phosphate acetyltransferase n=1 Tax=Paracoccus aminovorans TaxID=34004 RepID=A0A1I3EJI3_9RHOB|nr:phosphate acetyltransferase [Paracoccus aminovorans]CQR84346.1 Phosphate acetyltransferase [Paracoccus aminovorans]CQR84525.1 Phosphate acetyltransferase [Paracoccus aminovorans]SFH52638.1 phosphate acetyltransferase [Paracoccus aminovorans]SFH99033.1 phosphate acetyltransferase [Paracoccus aminovorans]